MKTRYSHLARSVPILCLSLAPVGSLLATKTVHAESTESVPEEVLPPRALDVSVSYPAEASGNASVSMSFTVDVDGTVKDPEVDVGDEPFASAAVAATKNWLFEPATLGGQPVAVRIAMEVQFTQETLPAPVPETETPKKVDEVEATAPEAAPGPGTAVATVHEEQEVTVEGDRPPGVVTFSRAEARQVPGAFGDPLRAIDTMAGVSPVLSGLPLFYLRGAPPGNVGYYVDEIRLPFLFHAFLGPSVINSELIERVNLYPSWYPARFGGFAGGLVEAELRAPRYERTISMGVGLWEGGAFVETPFSNEKGNLFVGGRYGFTGLLLSAVTAYDIEYWNYQALAEYQLDAKNSARVFLLGAYDYFEDPASRYLGVEFHRLDLRLDHQASPDTLIQGGVTVGVDGTRFDQARVLDRLATARLRVNHQADESLLLRTGLDVGVDSFDLTLDARERLDNYLDIRDLFPAREDLVLGLFAETVWRPTPDVTVVPGVRGELYRSVGDTELGANPQISTRYQLRPKLAAVHTLGLTQQPPNYVPTIPGVRVAGLEGGLQKSLHSSAGVEAELPYDWRGSLIGFENVFLDLTDPYSLTQNFALDPVVAKRRLTGHAYGLELELRRPLTRRFGAMLTYTLSRSTRSFDRIETLAGSDRTHVVNLAGMYTLGKNWRVGGRAVFYSGLPGRQRFEERFPHPRAAPFFRLDLRLERRFRLGPRSFWSIIAEGLNVTASKETLTRTCDEFGCEDEVKGPVFLPNVKLEAQF